MRVLPYRLVPISITLALRGHTILRKYGSPELYGFRGSRQKRALQLWGSYSLSRGAPPTRGVQVVGI